MVFEPSKAFHEVENTALLNRTMAACPILAALLHLGFTEWGTQNLKTFCDGSVQISGPLGPVLWEMGGSVADVVPFADSSSPCIRAFSNAAGLFARFDLPLPLVVGGGVIIPLILVCFSAYMMLRLVGDRTRKILAGLFGIMSLLSATLLAIGLRQFFRYGLHYSIFPVLITLTLGAATFAAVAVWLWRTASTEEIS